MVDSAFQEQKSEKPSEKNQETNTDEYGPCQVGDTIKSIKFPGQTYQVRKMLGGGGQAAVWIVSILYDDKT